MPRNASLPLTDWQLENVCRFSLALFIAQAYGDTVTLEYVKRDGTGSTSTGVIVAVAGHDSTLSVVVETENKGPRTINMGGLSDVHSVSDTYTRCEDCQACSADVTYRDPGCAHERALCDECNDIRAMESHSLQGSQ